MTFLLHCLPNALHQNDKRNYLLEVFIYRQSFNGKGNYSITTFLSVISFSYIKIYDTNFLYGCLGRPLNHTHDLAIHFSWFVLSRSSLPSYLLYDLFFISLLASTMLAWSLETKLREGSFLLQSLGIFWHFKINGILSWK